LTGKTEIRDQFENRNFLTQIDADQVWVELWVSLASLLRSYTAAHGLRGNRQATVELGESLITVRHGERWLRLERYGARVKWHRQYGVAAEVEQGDLELTAAGRLKNSRDLDGEEEMDLKAEEWARELMK
jgi:hypothetical protein